MVALGPATKALVGAVVLINVTIINSPDLVNPDSLPIAITII